MEDQPGAPEVRRLFRRPRRGRLGQAGSLSSKVFAALLVVGVIVRAAALPLPGTRDTIPWRIWSYNAAQEGVSRLYGVGGQPEPERRMLAYAGAEGVVDYPPLALHELGIAGRAYRWLMNGSFPNTTPLMIAVKAPAALADCLIAVLIYFAVRARLGERAARWATLAYWLNPAIVLEGEALGYLDPQFLLPIGASLVAASSGWGLACGTLGAAAILTKPQAVIVAPAVALALWKSAPGLKQQRAALAGALAGGTAITAAVVLPIFAAGGGPNMLLALSRLSAHDMMSGNACNLWWIVGWIVRVQYTIQDYGFWGALTRQTQILAISRFVDVGYPNPRVMGTILPIAAIAWALWSTRARNDIWLMAAAAAFSVHAYATLGIQVHENHLYGAVPFLAIAAAGRRRLLPVFIAVSAIFVLNLNLFYGISEDVGYAVPRGLTVIDMSVVLSVINCAALAWHARLFKRECRLAPHAAYASHSLRTGVNTSSSNVSSSASA